MDIFAAKRLNFFYLMDFFLNFLPIHFNSKSCTKVMITYSPNQFNVPKPADVSLRDRTADRENGTVLQCELLFVSPVLM